MEKYGFWKKKVDLKKLDLHDFWSIDKYYNHKDKFETMDENGWPSIEKFEFKVLSLKNI